MSKRLDESTAFDRLRRYEHGLALVWLLLVGIASLTVVGPVRGAVLDRVQGAVTWWDGRWTERLREGERLVKAGNFVEAQTYLERLDKEFPARNVRHARDQEKERLLTLLAQTYEALDRRALAMATYQRLVDFDPNHYRNYFALAQASDRLLSRGLMAVEARDAYAAALRIFPAHLPSVRGYIHYYVDRGEFAPIVDAYEQYLNAFLVQHIEVRLGNEVAVVPVQVDGRARDYEVPLSTVLSGGEILTITTGGFPVAIQQINLRSGTRTGLVAAVNSADESLSGLEFAELEDAEHGALRSTGPNAALRIKVPESLRSVSQLRLRVALFKPVDRDLWRVVSRSYENLLNEAALRAATERSVVFASADAADSVVARLGWARAGLLDSLDDPND
jgi:tetratricopeptide (TPR) repeat protein